MSQDTRKDRRVKIVSLNVRYKSATVDEFIENHSYDVSKGGIFIKTPTPFPPGTLLKFEIRIAGDKAVISGVGRVVWKREASQASTEMPAGMGVKFIDLDEASEEIIGRLLATNKQQTSEFEPPTRTVLGLGTALAPGEVAVAKTQLGLAPAASPAARRAASTSTRAA